MSVQDTFLKPIDRHLLIKFNLMLCIRLHENKLNKKNELKIVLNFALRVAIRYVKSLVTII